MGVISPSPSSAPCDSAEQVKSHFRRHLLLPQPGPGSQAPHSGGDKGMWLHPGVLPLGTRCSPQPNAGLRRGSIRPLALPHRIQPRQFPSSRNVTLQGPSVMTQRFEWKQRL